MINDGDDDHDFAPSYSIPPGLNQSLEQCRSGSASEIEPPLKSTALKRWTATDSLGEKKGQLSAVVGNERNTATKFPD